MAEKGHVQLYFINYLENRGLYSHKILEKIRDTYYTPERDRTILKRYKWMSFRIKMDDNTQAMKLFVFKAMVSKPENFKKTAVNLSR